jgi:hypothetical protein
MTLRKYYVGYNLMLLEEMKKGNIYLLYGIKTSHISCSSCSVVDQRGGLAIIREKGDI